MFIKKIPQNPFDRDFINEELNTSFAFGAGTYIGSMNVINYDTSRHGNILIGRFSSLAHYVNFLLSGNHEYKNVTTYPFDDADVIEKITEPLKLEGIKPFSTVRPNRYQIIIGHDVWIGYGAMIMGGVKIGNGAVIGTNAVVAKDIPPYAIAVGNPARVVKYRFDEATIKKFFAVKWWNWDVKKILQNIQLMTDVDKFFEQHYSPELEKIPEDDGVQQINRLGGAEYHFIADFRAKKPLWRRVLRGFCRSNFKDSLLVISCGKDTTDQDFSLLVDTMQDSNADAGDNIIILEPPDGQNFSPLALRQGTHFITTPEMTTLEALDYLWNTDVKIVSALDDNIFDGEPPVDWQNL